MSYCFYGGELEYVNMYGALADTDTLPNIEDHTKTLPATTATEMQPEISELPACEVNTKFHPMASLPSPPMPSEPLSCEWSTIDKPTATYTQSYHSPTHLYESADEVAWASQSLFGLNVTHPQSPVQVPHSVLLGSVSCRPESPLEPVVKVEKYQPATESDRKQTTKPTLKKKGRRCRKQYGTIYDDFGNEIVDPVKRSRKRIAMLIEEDNLRRKYEEQERAKIAAARIQRAERRAKAHDDSAPSQQSDSSIRC